MSSFDNGRPVFTSPMIHGCHRVEVPMELRESFTDEDVHKMISCCGSRKIFECFYANWNKAPLLNFRCRISVGTKYKMYLTGNKLMLFYQMWNKNRFSCMERNKIHFSISLGTKYHFFPSHAKQDMMCTIILGHLLLHRCITGIHDVTIPVIFTFFSKLSVKSQAIVIQHLFLSISYLFPE